jgi:S1-C subfamily serine protease
VVLVAGALGIVLVVGLARLLLPPDGSAPGTVSATGSDAAVAASLSATTPPSNADTSGRPSVTAVLPASDDRPSAVAIGVGNVLLTTAAAVDGRTQLTVELAGGEVVSADVVTVDQDAGIAVLEAEAKLQPVTTAAAPSGGDEVTVLVGEGVQAVVSVDADGVLWLRPFVGEGPMEGTPVLNDDGDVVGLCSRTGSGRSRLVPVDIEIDTNLDKDAASTTSTVAPADHRPWLGISATRTAEGTPASTTAPTDGAPGGVLIGGVMDASPAAAAGLVAGDVILTVDGEDVASIEALAEMIADRQPGDQVVLGVRPAADPTTVLEITVPLGHWPVAA